jgi:hypothetical protein
MGRNFHWSIVATIAARWATNMRILPTARAYFGGGRDGEPIIDRANSYGRTGKIPSAVLNTESDPSLAQAVRGNFSLRECFPYVTGEIAAGSRRQLILLN